MKVNEMFTLQPFIFREMATQLTTMGFDLWDTTTGSLLDQMYIIHHSGNKEVTAGIEKQFENVTKPVNSSGALRPLVQMLWTKYATSWKHYAGYTEAEYNPINNYDMVEVETPNITRQVDSSQQSDVTSINSRNSFNSETMVDVDKTNTTGDLESNAQASTETETGTRTLTRSGNIGVTTTGQILDIDSKFWTNWNMYERIFKDVDTFITNGLY